jgi:hypothetical protein
MNKKVYYTPEMEIVDVNCQTILCASIPNGNLQDVDVVTNDFADSPELFFSDEFSF